MSAVRSASRLCAALLILTAASDAAGQRRSFAALAICSLPATPAPSAWRSINLGNALMLRLSAALTPQPVEGFGCAHGCDHWKSADLDVIVTYGYWSEGSFEESRWATACRLPGTELSTVVMHPPGSSTMTIWPIRPGPRVSTSPIIRVDWRAPATLADAELIASSLSVTPGR